MDLIIKINLDAKRINNKTAEKKKDIIKYFTILLHRSVNSGDVSSSVYYRAMLSKIN